MVATRALRVLAAIERSLPTCTASSRVGTTIRACGAPGFLSCAQPSSSRPTARCSAGMPKPRVLPVPVLAWPMMSCPDRAMGRVMAWMGNGEVMPWAASASTMSWRTPKSANEDSSTGSAVSMACAPDSSSSGASCSGDVCQNGPSRVSARGTVTGARAGIAAVGRSRRGPGATARV